MPERIKYLYKIDYNMPGRIKYLYKIDYNMPGRIKYLYGSVITNSVYMNEPLI